MWKSKKNVVITYAAIPGQPPTTFDDIVSYNAEKDPKGKKKSEVKGVDRLEEGRKAAWKWYVWSLVLRGAVRPEGVVVRGRCGGASFAPHTLSPSHSVGRVTVRAIASAKPSHHRA